MTTDVVEENKASEKKPAAAKSSLLSPTHF